ncbi:RNA polymerase sigma factor [Paenibacillus harenae]|uniref:RNA polymerase sigma factor n=1 Tax=Paenibacillus harenae TaxID=306543 RepID=UPI00278F6F0C|nr:sigma-70 family RNA polymerase sigma factor [Paenibacillus harenae]MDQ0062784.1 RNA polymerase sigma-70 factor (ECF subfamily) [Paenibacillus harenae]
MEIDKQLKEWMELYYDRLCYVAYSYVRDRSRAEDAVQEAFVNAYLKVRQLKDKDRPYPWLVRIVINQCLNTIRNHKREKLAGHVPERSIASTEDVYMERSRDREVYAGIMSLEAKFRMPIILYYFEDMSVKEMAYALGIGEGAAKTRLARGRKQLENLLRRGDSDECGESYSSGKTGLSPR